MGVVIRRWVWLETIGVVRLSYLKVGVFGIYWCG